MRRLTMVHRPDHGAVAVIMTIVLSTGVLLGCAALTVDVGNLNAERRQLQNGSDAAALSAALDCAKATCPTATSASLTGLANANATDGASRISRTNTALPAVCGNGPGLTACPATDGTLGDCVTPHSALPPKYVRVYTQTQRPGGSTILPYYFAQTLAGGFSGATQQTCSSAAWGSPGGGTTLIPFTISACEWFRGTHSGTVYATSPAYDAVNRMDANNPLESALALNAANTAACATWAGHDLPGGFGWLDHDSTCKVAVNTNNWVPGDTGVGAGNDCASDIKDAVGKVIYLPVFDCADDSRQRLPCAGEMPNGADSSYHIQGLAAMFVTAVDITGPVSKALPGYPTSAAQTVCNAKGGKCLYGWFLKGLIDPSAVIDSAAPDLGLSAVQVVG